MALPRQGMASPAVAAVLISVLVWLAVMGLRSTGVYELLELTAYDVCLRLQPEPPGPDPRIVLIQISEQDIRAQQRWPLTDETLAGVLDQIAQAQPRAIGLDIFRDLPVPPGGEELTKVLLHNPNIIAIMKFGNGRDGTVPPPPVLENTEQIGANDIIVDPDAVVRRGLLFLDDGKTTAYSFALRLALLYLQAEGVVPQPDPLNPQYIRLGPTTIRPFTAYDGAYIGADARGYQFLLDFKGARWPFRSFSLTALLSGAVAPEVLKDKIVLLGVTAESVKDFFSTPYNHGFLTKQQTSGIATQAHIVSQLLRLGLGNAAPLRTATEWQEWTWVLLWSILGSLL